jgi:hypothetical protein
MTRNTLRLEVDCLDCGDSFVHYQSHRSYSKKEFCDYCLTKRAKKRRLERVKSNVLTCKQTKEGSMAGKAKKVVKVVAKNKKK